MIVLKIYLKDHYMHFNLLGTDTAIAMPAGVVGISSVAEFDKKYSIVGLRLIIREKNGNQHQIVDHFNIAECLRLGFDKPKSVSRLIEKIIIEK